MRKVEYNKIKKFLKQSFIGMLMCAVVQQGGGITSVSATGQNETNTSSANECLKYINMPGDFSDRGSQPEHRQWIQGCVTGKGVKSAWGGGICGCNSSKVAEECWSPLRIGSGSTCGSIGCVTVSVAMMMVETGAVTDSNFTPDEFIRWGQGGGNRLWGGGSSMQWANITQYCPNVVPVDTSQSCRIVSSYGSAVEAVEKTLEDGLYMTGWVKKNHGHMLYVIGTAINPATGEKDVVVSDVGTGRIKSMYLKELLKGQPQYAGLLELNTFKVVDAVSYITTGGLGTSTNTGVELQNSQITGNTTVGTLCFEEDTFIDIEKVSVELTGLQKEDDLRLKELSRELESLKATKIFGIIAVVSRIMGVLLLLYALLCLLSYLNDVHGGFVGITLLPIITFGRVTAIENAMETYDTPIGLTPIKALITFIVTVLAIGVLFNIVPVISKVYFLINYYM